MPEVVVGIDPSAKKIAVVGRHDLTATVLATTCTLYEKGQTRQDVASLARALQWLDSSLVPTLKMLAANGDVHVWVEDPLMGVGGFTATLKQAYVGGIIRAVLTDHGFNVHGVNVSVWKRDVVGTGRAKKPDVERAVRMKWTKAHAACGGDGDLYDAAAICLYGGIQRRQAIPG